jgi:hypothetical protein
MLYLPRDRKKSILNVNSHEKIVLRDIVWHLPKQIGSML